MANPEQGRNLDPEPKSLEIIELCLSSVSSGLRAGLLAGVLSAACGGKYSPDPGLVLDQSGQATGQIDTGQRGFRFGYDSFPPNAEIYVADLVRLAIPTIRNWEQLSYPSGYLQFQMRDLPTDVADAIKSHPDFIAALLAKTQAFLQAQDTSGFEAACSLFETVEIEPSAEIAELAEAYALEQLRLGNIDDFLKCCKTFGLNKSSEDFVSLGNGMLIATVSTGDMKKIAQFFGKTDREDPLSLRIDLSITRENNEALDIAYHNGLSSLIGAGSLDQVKTYVVMLGRPTSLDLLTPSPADWMLRELGQGNARRADCVRTFFEISPTIYTESRFVAAAQQGRETIVSDHDLAASEENLTELVELDRIIENAGR